MTGLKTQLGWMRNGAERTNASLASFAGELRDLQEKVENLTAVVARLDASVARIDGEGTAAIEAMKSQLRTITDDLGDRVGALSERLDLRPAD